MTTGTRVGPYEVVAKLGEGGMGEVYRARDTKLDRDVALKILPESFASDPDRLMRFEREAKTLASLNHPNIAAIYGIEERALVMELVEGEDLSARIARGSIPIDEALPIAKQIAEALEAAHEQGIVHRDLKPANVKIRPDGTVKVLDFGLAKAIDPGSGIGDPGSATITSPAMTMRGVILGTAAYMAPEQAKGKAVDKRADIWAFGCVLFEMLTGAPAFAGDSVSDVLAEVIKSEPGWGALPAQTPPAVRRLLRRCLAKDLKQRIGDAATARLEIADALSGAETNSPSSQPMSRRRERLAWTVAAAATVVAAVVIGVPSLSRTPSDTPSAPEVRFTLDGTPPLANGAVSPDGTLIVYRERVGRELVVRSLSSGARRVLIAPGNPGARSLAASHFWSPDATAIAFFADQKLRRIDVESGATQTLADAPTPRGGAWAPDGTILFAPGGNGPLYRVSAAGGAPQAATALGPLETSHRDPQFLPGGRRFIYWVGGPSAVRGVYLGSLDGSSGTRLLEADGPAAVAGGDRVLFVREGVLYAQRLDSVASKMTGDPATVAAGLTAGPFVLRSVSASQNGVIAYVPESEDQMQLQWVDRSGTTIERIGEPRGGIGGAVLSPDGGTLAFTQTKHGLADVWLWELARGTLTRLVADASNPIWSSDGSRLAYTSGLSGQLQMYSQKLDGSGAPQIVFKSLEGQNLADWSPDGRHLLFSSQSATNARDLWSVPVDEATPSPIPVAQSPAEETDGTFSPDGKWVAYTSDETGAIEVFARPFPGPGRAWPVSTAGGTNPFWRRDGRELYYLSGGHVMAVGVDATASTLKLGAPARLFPMRGSVIAAPDGRRFLVTAGVGDLPTPPLTIIVNSAALRAKQ